jgi:hypothetical protein
MRLAFYERVPIHDFSPDFNPLSRNPEQALGRTDHGAFIK